MLPVTEKPLIMLWNDAQLVIDRCPLLCLYYNVQEVYCLLIVEKCFVQMLSYIVKFINNKPVKD